MSDTPPTTTEEAPEQEPELTIEEQIDSLLVQIEQAEPGTLDPEVLPADYHEQQEESQEQETPKSEASEGMSPFQQAMAEEATAQAAEPAAQPEATEPAAAEPAPAEQPDMLAALSSALQGIGSGTPSANKPAEPAAEPTEQTQADTPAEPQGEQDTDQLLQDEIAALLDEAPQPTQQPEPQAAAEQPAPELSQEDQIAQEIEGLLNAEAQAPAPAEPEAAADETSIDDLDQMLADEIDADDDLAGDFQSVQDITSGIQTEAEAEEPEDDAHAATARDVAAELDSQPEDQPAPEPVAAFPDADIDEDDDPLAMLSQLAETAETNEKVYQTEQKKLARLDLPTWIHRYEVARDKLLRACFAINWPARRFMTKESRANLGYIALLNLFGAAAVWLYVIFL